MYGWCGKIARINLLDQTGRVDIADPDILKTFIWTEKRF